MPLHKISDAYEEPGIYVSMTRALSAELMNFGVCIYRDDRLNGDDWYAITTEPVTEEQYEELRQLMARKATN